MEVGVEEHDGAGESVDRVLGLVAPAPESWVALQVPLAEVEENPLAVLSLSSQAELLQELPQSLVKRLLAEGEQLKQTVRERRFSFTRLDSLTLQYSSATALEKSLFLERCLEISDFRKPSRL